MRAGKRELVLGLLLLVLFVTAVVFDYLAAMSLYRQGVAFFVAAGLLVGALFLPAARRGAVLALVGLYVGGLLALRLAALSPVKPFRAAYEAIEPGMTRSEVLAELDLRFPEHGRFAKPVASGSGDGFSWRLDPTDGRYDSEIVTIQLADGRVVGKDYLPD